MGFTALLLRWINKMSLTTLCQVKTAVHLDPEHYPLLFDLYFDEEINADAWENLIKQNIYPYWEYVGDDDAGYKIVVVFETSNIPEQQDFIKLINSFSQLETKLQIKANLKKIVKKAQKKA